MRQALLRLDFDQTDALQVETSGAPAGVAVDAYFDETYWIIRMLLLELNHRPHDRALMPIGAVEHVDSESRVIRARISLEEIQALPEGWQQQLGDEAQRGLAGDYNTWPVYWAAPQLLNPEMPQGMAPTTEGASGEVSGAAPDLQLKLRSVRELLGYRLVAADGELGRIRACVAIPDDWRICALESDSGASIRPDTARRIDWIHQAVEFDQTRAELTDQGSAGG